MSGICRSAGFSSGTCSINRPRSYPKYPTGPPRNGYEGLPAVALGKLSMNRSSASSGFRSVERSPHGVAYAARPTASKPSDRIGSEERVPSEFRLRQRGVEKEGPSTALRPMKQSNRLLPADRTNREP